MKAQIQNKRAKLQAQIDKIDSAHKAKVEAYSDKLQKKSEAKITSLTSQIEKLDAILQLLDEKPAEK